MGLTRTHEFPMGPADTGMQLGSSHLSGTHQEGCLPAGQALLMGLTEEWTAGRSQDAHVRESGTGEAPQGVPRIPAAPQERQPLGLCQPPGACNCHSELTRGGSSCLRRKLEVSR